MIATGTDVKPIECVVFMRMVKSRNFFEQMKGRGVRVIGQDDLRIVTPDATAKDHFVLVDAVGVTETTLNDTVPLERKYGVTVLRSLPDQPHENTEIVAAHVGERRKQLTDRRSGDNQLAKLNTTDMVHEAALAAFKDEALAVEVLAIWRLTSGAAHGFAWALYGQPGTVQSGPPDQHGIAPFSAGGDLDRIFNHYMAAFQLARHGMELLADRSAHRVGKSPA